jgi:YebC/PmpR family DNA-binding regulatory protein
MRANIALPSACALIVFGAMSGHSKWSQIKRQKGAADVKKGVVFTKMTREIMLAAREGGGDVEANFRLRLAVDRARAVNMPHSNIQRAIERATGGADGSQLESIVYEGYAPGGVSVMVEAATDNRNRTASEVRAAFTKNGGKLGESGSVQWLFEQKGVIEIDAGKRSSDDVSLIAIDSGAEDVETDGSLVTAYTTPSSFERVRSALEKAGITVASAEISMRPTTTVRVDGDQARRVLRLVEELEDLDDVQKVHANFDVPDEVLQHA